VLCPLPTDANDESAGAEDSNCVGDSTSTGDSARVFLGAPGLVVKSVAQEILAGVIVGGMLKAVLGRAHTRREETSLSRPKVLAIVPGISKSFIQLD
jgi:hypothetical protein